jgi:hypothetical protein
MAEHAAAHGLISRRARAQVLAEIESTPDRPATGRDIAGETRHAQGAGQLEAALEDASGDEAPQSVVVEADQRRE